MSMMTSNYPCSQPELYNLCRDGWHSCGLEIAAFTAFKSKYSDAFIAENLAAVNAADVLPDNIARYAPTKNLRVELIDKNTEVLDCFDVLKSYIQEAYRPEKVKTMIDAAGRQFADKANNLSWTSSTALLSAALPFMKENLTILTTEGFMPPAFYDRFKAAKVAFEDALMAWKASDKASVGLGKSVLTDENGRCDLSPIASGVYTIEVSKEGFNTTFTEGYEVEVGK